MGIHSLPFGGGLAWPPLELCKAVSHPWEGHKWASLRLSTLATGPDAPSLPAASMPNSKGPSLLDSGIVLQGSITTAIAKHSPPYLAAFHANGNSWYRLQIKVQLLPSNNSCLLPCTALLASAGQWEWSERALLVLFSPQRASCLCQLTPSRLFA